MARKDQERIAPREEVRLAGPRAQLTTVARPVDYAMPSGSGGELGALLQGLESFGGSVARRQAQQDKFDAEEARLSGGLAGDSQVDPEQVANLPPPEMPQGLNPAFKEHFDAAFKGNLGARIAGQVQDRVLTGYQANRTKPDFNPEAYLAEAAAKETAGIQDPTLRASVLANFNKTAELVRADHRKVMLDRLNQQEKENVFQLLGSSITPEMDPGKMAEVYYSTVLPRARQGGIVTPTEAAEGFLRHVVGMSTALGGRPELFDAFLNAKDPATGMLLRDLNPQLRAQAEAAKQQAQHAFDKKTEEALQGEFASVRRGYEESARRGIVPAFEDLKASLLGSGRVFKTDDQFISFYHGLEQQAKGHVDLAEAVQRIREGKGIFLDEKIRKKALEAITGPALALIEGQYGEYLRTKDPRILDTIRTNLGDVVRYYGGTNEINDTIKGLINAPRGEPMSKDGNPPGNFLLAAELYSSMPAGMREKYTDADSAKLFDLYRLGINQQMTEKAAYQQAFNGITVAGKMADDAMRKPDSLLNKHIGDALRGSQSDGSLWGWITTKMGFVPENLRTSIEDDVKAHMWRVAQLDPHMARNKDWVKMKVEDYVQANYFKDTTNDLLVKKEPGIPAEVASAVVAYKQQQWAEQRPEIAAAEAKVMIVPGQAGQYQANIVDRDGRFIGVLQNFDMRQEVESMRLSGKEGSEGFTNAKVLGELRQRQREGKLDGAFLEANKDTIARLRVVGALKDGDTKAIEKVEMQVLKEKSAKTMSLTMGRPDLAKFDTAASGYARGDTLSVAQRLLDQGLHGAALTATREGFVAQASPDPNRSAGNNIGFGYNLKSRDMDTIKEDFRKAGIPVEHAQSVVDGKVSITPEQGMRLLLNTRKTYEKQAEQALRLAGKWDQTPQNVKDVLADVAYQTGNVSQFVRAFEAIQKGDIAGLDKLLTVKYRKGAGEELQPDTRGNNLRAHLLTSPETFKVGLQSAKAKPSTKLDALAAASTK